MSDRTEQYRLPPWVSVRHVPDSGYYLEDERGRWVALARREWQIPLVFEMWAGIVAGLHAAGTDTADTGVGGSPPGGLPCRTPAQPAEYDGN